MAGTGKKVMALGMDNSEPSFYALQWTLDHFFVPFGQDPPFKLLIIHAQPPLASVVGFTGPGLVDVIPIMEADSKKRAQNVVEKAREVCNNTGVTNVVVEVIEGDARNVICDAVDRHHASILVVGSHNYGAVKRYCKKFTLIPLQIESVRTKVYDLWDAQASLSGCCILTGNLNHISGHFWAVLVTIVLIMLTALC